jgi:hypothetical protein
MTSTPEHTPWWSDGDEQRLSVADHQLRKTRLMVRKCYSCIFHGGDLMRLGPGRLAEIVNQSIDAGGFIVCHNSLPHGPHPDVAPAICRGFYDAYDTQALQVARRLWGFVEVAPPQPQPGTDTGTDPGPPSAAPHPQEERT